MNVLDLFNDDNRRGYRTMLEGIASNLVESKKLEQKTTINEGVRLIGSKEAGNRSVKVFRDTEWNEYIVRFYIDDEYQEEADYHTDDKQDAVDTAGKWLKGFPKQGVAEGKPNQLPTKGADYSQYDTDHLRTLLKPGILHRNEAKFKALIRKELQKREQQGVAEGSEDLRAKLDLYNEKAFEAGHRHDDQAWRKYTKLAKQIADQLGLKYKVTGYGLEILEQGVAEGQTEGEATLAKIAAAGDEGWDMIDDGINGLLGTEAQIMLQDMYDDVSREYRLHPDDDFEQIFDRMMDRIQDDYGQSGVAEDQEQDPVAAFLARGGKIQHGKTHKPRKAEKWQGSAHIGTDGGKGSKGTVSGLGANTNPRSGKPVVAAEQAVAEAMRNTDDPFNDMVEDYLDYLESIGELRKSREEEKADLIADLEAGYIHPSEIEYALSGTEWDPLAESQLGEISADPAYLRAAERSRSQAQATQRTPGKSPEEKAAARRTELKRDRGIAGYSKRHKAAHPEMYPKVTPRPAPKLRDPSTEYSDDYSTWAAGRRDTMEDPDQPKQEKRKRLDPELKNLATYAQGHYTDYRDDPETALLKLLQRSSEHGEETDRQQDRKIRNLERKINTVNQQMSSMPMAESRAQRRTLLKKILKG